MATEPSTATFSEKLSAAEINALEAGLRAGAFEFRDVPHARFSARGEGIVCTVYNSGKCVIQGRGLEQFLAHRLGGRSAPEREPKLAALNEFDHLIIGSDESGKGDFFGPLVVAAVAFGPEHLPLLDEIRFTDSKKMTAGAIRAAAAVLKERVAHEIVVVSPRRYNELYAKIGNLNHLLAWCHGRALSAVYERHPVQTVIVDKFCEERTLVRSWPEPLRRARLVLRTKAESNPAVAAASVLASDAFTRGLDRLGRSVDLTLPKGAGRNVDLAAKRLVTVRGREILAEVAKLHFANTAKI